MAIDLNELREASRKKESDNENRILRGLKILITTILLLIFIVNAQNIGKFFILQLKSLKRNAEFIVEKMKPTSNEIKVSDKLNLYPLFEISVSKGLNEQAEEFLTVLLTEYSSSNDTALMSIEKYWGDQILYKSEKVNKKELIQEKSAFMNQWPLRAFFLVPNSLEVDCNQLKKTCYLNGTISWTAENDQISPIRKIKGEYDFIFGVDMSANIPVVFKESGWRDN